MKRTSSRRMRAVVDPDRVAALASMAERANDAIFAVDRERRLVAFNARFASEMRQTTGSEPRIGEGDELISVHERSFFKALFARAFAGDNVTVAFDRACAGRLRRYQIHVEPLRVRRDSPDIVGAAVRSRDVTFDEAVREAERTVLDLVARGAPTVEVLGHVARLVETFCPDAACSIVTAHEGALRRLASGPAFAAPFRSLEDSTRDASGWWAAKAFGGEVVVANDLANDVACASMRSAAMALGVRAARAVPIVGDRNGVAGALVAYLRAPWSVDPSLFARAAELASIVLHRERVDRGLRDATRDGAVVHSLVAGLAHEVRNALFGVAATIDAFEQRLGAQPDYAPYLGVLREQIDRIASLMRDLLDYGSPFALRLAPVSINDVLRAAARGCQSLADARGVTVALNVQPGLPPLFLDRARMVQVFHDVVENALHHSQPNAAVRVNAVLEAQGTSVLCEVVDEGSGFSQADLPFVFEPFFSRRRGGTGLGLAISRRMVIEHEGTIDVANGAAGGAVVRVRLPVRRGA